MIGDFPIQFSIYTNCLLHHIFLAWEACALTRRMAHFGVKIRDRPERVIEKAVKEERRGPRQQISYQRCKCASRSSVSLLLSNFSSVLKTFRVNLRHDIVHQASWYCQIVVLS